MMYRRRRMLIAGLAMLLSGPAALALKPGRLDSTQPPVALEYALPPVFSGWRMDNRLMQTHATDETSAAHGRVVRRIYTNDQGESVSLMLTYGGDDNDALKGRRPEENFSVQGMPVSHVRRDRIQLPGASLQVTRVTVVTTASGGRTEPMTYWITVGDRAVRNRGQWLAAQLRQGLAGRSVETVQISVSTLADDIPKAFVDHDRFITNLLAAVSGPDLSRLTGYRPS